jgi:hypothetical protein
MRYHRELILNLFDVGSLIDQRLIENLDRLEQLDKIAHWYEGFNPLPHLVELTRPASSGGTGRAFAHKYNPEIY